MSSVNQVLLFLYKYLKNELTAANVTLSCMMLKNGQAYFKNLAVWKPQDF